ncbi:MAG TPA: DNA-binding domain-containing protein [Bradyrhizobium sp.]|jgi:hypothetical protein|nr:DNA-binding domain-containing protein [Bradyrhizobium sp.]
MPTLLEMQTAMQASLVHRHNAAVSAMLAGHITADRLDIYRNTFIHTLTKALRLSFPVTERLVGEEFFEGAAHFFIAEHPPREAWLDRFGDEFPDFLRTFPQAMSIVYLGDVAELEWEVNSALHAADVARLDVAALGAVKPEDQGRIWFVAHPSVSLLRLAYPADAIWRAVLTGDDEALGKVDIESGPVNLLVERRETGIEVERLDRQSWLFLSKLCAGQPIEAVLGTAGDFDRSAALAEHLALGRFCRFDLAPAIFGSIDQGTMT